MVAAHPLPRWLAELSAAFGMINELRPATLASLAAGESLVEGANPPPKTGGKDMNRGNGSGAAALLCELGASAAGEAVVRAVAVAVVEFSSEVFPPAGVAIRADQDFSAGASAGFLSDRGVSFPGAADMCGAPGASVACITLSKSSPADVASEKLRD